ncbi:MAG: nucleoid occlusion protein [Firmicutes bacterium]|jgi:ParB family chromosome partitioning protein|nr:nucleoid occlusion protein [Bacillota bacterium]
MKENRFHNLLFPDPEPGKDKVAVIKIQDIEPNPYQPRRNFPDDTIAELMQSIKTYGLLQPIIVRRAGRSFQLVAGERRLVACKKLGLNTITAIIKDLSDSAMAAIALIENLQRENLNFIEEASGYARLINEFNLTQEVLAQRLGKSQSTIANKLRLLKLPESVKRALIEEKLTERHARALLKLNTEAQQQKMIAEIIDKGLTVSQTEKRIEQLLGTAKAKTKKINKGIIRDHRIFLNTIREAVRLIKDSGLSPEVEEKVEDDFIEVKIRLFRR